MKRKFVIVFLIIMDEKKWSILNFVFLFIYLFSRLIYWIVGSIPIRFDFLVPFEHST